MLQAQYNRVLTQDIHIAEVTGNLIPESGDLVLIRDIHLYSSKLSSFLKAGFLVGSSASFGDGFESLRATSY